MTPTPNDVVVLAMAPLPLSARLCGVGWRLDVRALIGLTRGWLSTLMALFHCWVSTHRMHITMAFSPTSGNIGSWMDNIALPCTHSSTEIANSINFTFF